MKRPPFSRLGQPGARERRVVEELLDEHEKAVRNEPSLWKRDRIVGELGAAWPLLEKVPESESKASLLQRLQELRSALREMDERDVGGLRALVRQGTSPSELYARLADWPAPQHDPLLRRVFGVGVPPVPTLSLEAGMISLVSTNVDTLGDIAGKIRTDDTFVDIGSGLGTAVLLIRYLTGARALGVEIEPAYVESARSTAQDLELEADFVCSDARSADYQEGTAFFLYDPFHGSILSEFLERLRQDTEGRKIRIFAFGKCQAEISECPWLTHVSTTRTSVAEFCQRER